MHRSIFGPDIRYDKDKIIKIREQFGLFKSSETYTPFFDANAKELHSLSVKVLANITAFYTYWKATRDAFRKLADIQMLPLIPIRRVAQSDVRYHVHAILGF